ncbi:MAG: type IV toxin-antitoxin system AbiEi family antitoxin domain-containing protein [Actinomycetota bacterium]|nr:type IV toxin-antitoxin system AbiEi family antitoxin domain-containing protein [Actinomycetota bacterium]
MDLERRLQSFVATRHGIITRAEAAELGYSTSAIDRRIEQGLWIPVFRVFTGWRPSHGATSKTCRPRRSQRTGAAGMRTAVRLHGLHG